MNRGVSENEGASTPRIVDRGVSRRGWLAGSFAVLAAWPGWGKGWQGADPVAAVKAKARAAGMVNPFEASDSASYRAVGDAPAAFRLETLKVCEATAKEYREHFRARGFELTTPKEKLVVVVLASPQSYAQFEGGFVDEAVGGYFDLKENRLVTFDFRKRAPGTKAGSVVPEEDNTLALVHETIHQLTFNTGLLDLSADVPLLVSEGLATYGETWRPRGKGGIGSDRSRRPLGLEEGKKQGVGWIPLGRLLADDKLFEDEKTRQVAYAECWKFTHRMLKDPARLAKYRGYLLALKGNADPGRRLDLAREHLGDLDRLDAALKGGR